MINARYLAVLLCCGLLGCSGKPAPTPSEAFVAASRVLLDQLIEHSFPELQHSVIKIQGISSSDVFLATDIDIPSLLHGPRQYVLYLNPLLEQHSIDKTALKGILAHELSHFSDYENRNSLELAWLYLRILNDTEFVTQYERSTDQQSFSRGYALGIKAFRVWLYAQITAEQKRVKEKNYYTPDEIDLWRHNNPNH